ncbi:unnamed protein product, partial [Trichogramma brassicae]
MSTATLGNHVCYRDVGFGGTWCRLVVKFNDLHAVTLKPKECSRGLDKLLLIQKFYKISASSMILFGQSTKSKWPKTIITSHSPIQPTPDSNQS